MQLSITWPNGRNLQPKWPLKLYRTLPNSLTTRKQSCWISFTDSGETKTLTKLKLKHKHWRNWNLTQTLTKLIHYQTLIRTHANSSPSCWSFLLWPWASRTRPLLAGRQVVAGWRRASVWTIHDSCSLMLATVRPEQQIWAPHHVEQAGLASVRPPEPTGYRLVQ